MTSVTWIPGMLTTSGLRVIRVDEDGYTLGYSEKLGHTWMIGPDHEPDRHDLATRAILEVEDARRALGLAWLTGGATLAEGIRAKTRALEGMRGDEA